MRAFQIFLLAVLLGLSACSSDSEETMVVDSTETEERSGGASWREDHLELGKRTYEEVCSSCHDTGKMEAPLVGNPKDWSDRSNLWEAVLFEHAKDGYVEMPEKGGVPELSDEAVEAAAEYMLSITFPDMPRD